MVSGVFAVFDQKAHVYHAPFLSHNPATAMRLLSDVVADRSHSFGKHPMDYVLCQLGTFDDQSGVFVTELPKHLCLLSDLTQEVR